MNLSIGEKIALFFHCFLSIVAAALLVDNIREIVWGWLEAMPGMWSFALWLALGIVYALLNVFFLMEVFYRDDDDTEKPCPFITVDSSETGKVRIAVSAIEQMVWQAASSVKGISQMGIHIEDIDDAVAIYVGLTLCANAHVPTTTMNIQRAIRKYIEMNCGVAIQSVTVNVTAIEAPEEGEELPEWTADAPEEAAPAPEAAAQPTEEETQIPELVMPTLTLDPPAQEGTDAEEPSEDRQDE